MTISSSTSRVDYVGNGSTTAFAVPFSFFDTSELRVVSRVIATGVETVLSLGANYTVTGGGGMTGTVTAIVAPAATVQWSILRATRRTQDVDFQPNDPLPAETLEQALDRVVAIVQEVERDQLRSVRAAETDSTASLTLPTQGERASRILGFDVNGNPVPVLPEAGTLAATPYAQGILSSGSAATARGVLGATATGGALFTAADAAAARTAVGATATGSAVMTAADAAAGRSALGATATGSAVLTATDATAGRAALAASPTPTTTAGIGQVVQIASVSGGNLNAPAGGVWVCWFAGYAASGFTWAQPFAVLEVSGGALLQAGVAGVIFTGIAFRKS
jgi:hypothetical protein